MINDELVVKSSSSVANYGWREEKYRVILDLGTMKNAVVIHKSYVGNFFKIGQASFFPFTDAIYSKKFTNLKDAKNVANTYILTWLQDTNFALNYTV